MKTFSISGALYWLLSLFASAAASVKLIELIIKGELVGSLRFIVETYSKFGNDVFYFIAYPVSYLTDFLSWLFQQRFHFQRHHSNYL